MKKGSIYLFLLLLCLSSCVDDHNKELKVETCAYKVAVIMPASQQNRWERTAGWVLENISKAHQGLPKNIKLQIEWKDEDADDLEEYVEQIVEDDSYVAIIGPSYSVNAEKTAEKCYAKKKCLIVPIATSTEYQRINASKGHVWNMVQSDIAQCELLLSQVYLSGVISVSLLVCNNDYGRSFSDWFAFQATELGIEIGDITIYDNEEELYAAMQSASEQWYNRFRSLVFVPGSEEDVVAFDKKIGEMKEEAGGEEYFEFPKLLCSDMANSELLKGRLKNMYYEGISPSADPQSGFISAYTTKFGEEPVNGEAHLYDSFLLLSYALSAMTEGETINDAILRVVDGRYKNQCSWLAEDMSGVYQMLQQGGTPDLSGVTGDWTFDEKTHASVLNTTYAHWIYINGEYHTIDYLSTDGSGRTTSTLQAWDWLAQNKLQGFNQVQKDFDYPELHDKWAVVVGTSDTWANYRHQADALAMYQLLKRHGYDDEHIILIIEDNIAYHPRNIYPGIVRVRPDGANMYEDVEVDYVLSDITINDLHKIMTGKSSDRLPRTIHSTENDNVVVFWCGHGFKGELAWGSDTEITGYDVRNIVEEMNYLGLYRKMFFAIDACYSGSIGEACEGIPGVLLMTAANPNETSKADMKDPDMGLWLSNGFTRAFQEAIDENPNIVLRDLYYKLAAQTVGSHATVYNVENYGNVYTNTMREFLE